MNNKITGTLTKYLTENPNINTGISNSINCKKLSKFSISKYEAIGNDKTIKKINGAIKPRINIWYLEINLFLQNFYFLLILSKKTLPW